MSTKIGINLTALTHTALIPGAVLAEEVGFESVWMGEHLITPVQQELVYPGGTRPFDHNSPFLEPLVALAAIAGHTSTIRLGTAVLVIPVRDPFLTARELGTLDVLSGGRLDVGIGSGWAKEEFEILGSEWSTRGKRMEEFAEVIDRLFSGEIAEFHGQTIDMPAMGFGLKSPQGSRPPLHFGGYADAAIWRAALLGDGWLAGSGSPQATAENPANAARYVSRITEIREEAGLSAKDYLFSVMMLKQVPRDHVDALAEVGVQRVVLAPWRAVDSAAWPGTIDDIGAIEKLARDLGMI